MLRRLVLAGLASALTAPIFVTTPASATVLFTCPAIDSPTSSYMGFNPGWSHTQTAQNDWYNVIYISTACSNGNTGQIAWGSGWLRNPTVSNPTRPLGCPVAWGGAGPDYADQTPILLGSESPDPPAAFRAYFNPTGDSYGLVKAKAGPVGTQYRLVFNITSGVYAPPAGQKTKIKLTVSISPFPGYSYTCANDTDPLEFVALASVGSVIVQQK
jgi:hypothetical protein